MLNADASGNLEVGLFMIELAELLEHAKPSTRTHVPLNAVLLPSAVARVAGSRTRRVDDAGVVAGCAEQLDACGRGWRARNVATAASRLHARLRGVRVHWLPPLLAAG